jgi:hypothetical protein
VFFGGEGGVGKTTCAAFRESHGNVVARLLGPSSVSVQPAFDPTSKGVVVTGDVVLGLAGIDLVYLRLSAVLCAVESLVRREGK